MAALCCLWVALVTFGWARWGSVTVDSGRDLYVAAAVAEGKMLYRDLWYPYGPAAPYLNALLFRIFGTHITVAYVAGALSGLAQALILFRCALYLVSLPVAFAISYIILVQSFGPGIFTYPLPYSYAAVYGSVATSFFLLSAVRAAFYGTKIDVFWTALCSAVALLIKLEHGVACFGALAVLQVGLTLRERSWRAAFGNLLATLPAVLLCTVIIAWMVSIRGLAFLTKENFTSWPTSYFMQTYGQLWLAGQGLEFTWEKVLSAVLVTLQFVAFWTAFRIWLWPSIRKPSVHSAALGLIIAAGAVGLWVSRPDEFNDAIANLLFPRPMVFMVGVGVTVAAFSFWRDGWLTRDLAILLLTVLGLLLGIRILFGMVPYAYAIFYNGPVLLAFAWLLFSIAFPAEGTLSDARLPAAKLVLCAAVCVWVTVRVYPEYRHFRKGRVLFETDRGKIYLPETLLPGWAEAVDFMREVRTNGETVMSVPEDTALYFFAGVLCPVRVCIFLPGVVAPGTMTDEIIGQMRQAEIDYIIWSNRKFYEYGVGDFGVDFDRPIGEYIRSNYRPVRKFGSTEPWNSWHATLWEKAISQTAQSP